MVGLALLSGLRRGGLTVREVVYEGAFDTPKTTAGVRRIPLSATRGHLLQESQQQAKHGEPADLAHLPADRRALRAQREAATQDSCRHWTRRHGV
jgi:hypothetical protein